MRKSCGRKVMAFSAKRNNYTAVLERVYGISEGRIIHIHGSLRDHECDPVLGHGNIERIEQIDELDVIGHSVAEVDLPYFRYIENCTHRQSNWIVYFFNKEEKDRIYKNLMDSGIQISRIQMKEASEFYNL